MRATKIREKEPYMFLLPPNVAKEYDYGDLDDDEDWPDDYPDSSFGIRDDALEELPEYIFLCWLEGDDRVRLVEYQGQPYFSFKHQEDAIRYALTGE